MIAADDYNETDILHLGAGTIVTVYYTNRIDAHSRYHMGVVRWQTAESQTRGQVKTS